MFLQNSRYNDTLPQSAEIVCLGDYLDPYPGDDLHERGVFAPLKELVEVKKLHPERVHLLIGNHNNDFSEWHLRLEKENELIALTVDSHSILTWKESLGHTTGVISPSMPVCKMLTRCNI